jgi:phosphatidate cytidylyltransferase
MFVILYPGLLTGFVGALKSYEAVYDGTKLVMVLFALVWVNDAGAFFAGSALGKRKLAPRISPNKTWEGTIGGFAASVLLGLVIAALSRFTAGQGLLLGVILGVIGPLGDLAESALKRGAGVKDSGALLPGHGGVLDRIDSVIVCAPLLYYFVLTTHYAELLTKFGVTP